MEFNKKLQELRKQKGLTQDELAEKLFVSRTAVSKWEMGRGYPNIESLKDIAKFFDVTVDALLSSEELLTLSEADGRKKEGHFRDLVFGLLDVCTAMLVFLPFFAQKTEASITGASLLTLTNIAPYLKGAFCGLIFAIVIFGIAILAFQNCERGFWLRIKTKISLSLNTFGVLLFIISRQPYAAVLLLVFLIIKALTLIKRQ